MSDLAGRHAAMQELWDVYRSIRARRGLDIARLWAEWAKQKRESLKDFSAENSFDELCRAGCTALPLAATMAIIQPLRSFEKKWLEITGPARQRKQKIRTIEKAATALEDLLGSLADVLIANFRGSMDTDSLEVMRKEIMSPTDVAPIVKGTPVPDPATTIHALRMYASLLDMFHSLAEDTSIASSDMFAKYLISGYVYRATGSFHDAEVSALIGAVLRSIYDETAHRVWRARNYERIDQTLSGIVDMLTDFGVVSASVT